MNSTPIQAMDERVLPFSAEEIWRVLADVVGYQNWWPPSVGLKLLSATTEIIGSELEVRPRGGRPFRCRVESLEPPRRMRMRYGGGFIEGTGEWRLEQMPGSTRVVYDLNVKAKGWMVALLGRLLPLGRMHSRFMGDILQNLERETARRHRPGP